MQTLPRHLLFAAVMLTLCCAERQAVSLDWQRVASELAGQKPGARHAATELRAVERMALRKASHRQQVRPAALDRLEQAAASARHAGAAGAAVAHGPDVPAVHDLYPPSRFRLPPPASLA